MLNDASGFRHVYLCYGYTDLRKRIDGLIAIVTETFGLDPTEAESIFLFCGRRNDRMKALLYGKRQILMWSDTKLPQPFASWSNSL